MAKALGEKTVMIRKGITDHPDLQNKQLAEKLGKGISANDVAQQRTTMKKQGLLGGAEPNFITTDNGKIVTTEEPYFSPKPPREDDPLTVLDDVYKLIDRLGSAGRLSMIVSRIAQREK